MWRVPTSARMCWAKSISKRQHLLQQKNQVYLQTWSHTHAGKLQSLSHGELHWCKEFGAAVYEHCFGQVVFSCWSSCWKPLRQPLMLIAAVWQARRESMDGVRNVGRPGNEWIPPSQHWRYCRKERSRSALTPQASAAFSTFRWIDVRSTLRRWHQRIKLILRQSKVVYISVIYCDLWLL